MLVVSLFITINNFRLLRTETCKISTSHGTIYTNRYYGDSSSELINFVNQNTDKNDKIVIFPEGMTINFLTERKSDDYYNSLLPLYVETFGEEKLIDHYKKNSF